jgi:hypothetical protein
MKEARMKANPLWTALAIVLLTAACGGPKRSTATPSAAVVVVEVPTPTPEESKPSPSPAPVTLPDLPSQPLELRAEDVRGSWHNRHWEEGGVLPVTLTLPVSETVRVTVVPHEPPVVLIQILIRHLSPAGFVQPGPVWVRALHVERRGDQVVVAGLEQRPGSVANCPAYAVPEPVWTGDWYGVRLERGEKPACLPLRDLPPEVDGMPLIDAGFDARGRAWALYGRWVQDPPDPGYEMRVRSPDGEFVQVPVRYQTWNYILEGGLICGFPKAPFGKPAPAPAPREEGVIPCFPAGSTGGSAVKFVREMRVFAQEIPGLLAKGGRP